MSWFAWRILTYEMGRTTLAVGGIFIALLMIFLQLGFYVSVPEGGMQVYNGLRFDLLLVSRDYVYQAESYEFPRRRLYQALSLPEVESAEPVYQGDGHWLNADGHESRDIFIFGVRARHGIFAAPEIDQHVAELRRPDTILVDNQTLPMFGALTPGRKVEINHRGVEIAGTYRLGTGFIGLGAAITSDVNFIRIFPQRTLAAVNLGLVTLRPGSDADRAAARLRAMLPSDTEVFTHAQLPDHEVEYWNKRTATGLIFGFGVVVSVIVGIVILYQTLATQIARQLPQYATLKAMGYGDADLRRIVIYLALLVSSVALVPAIAAAIAIYGKVRVVTRLPIEMTLSRLIAVTLAAILMSLASSLLAVRGVGRADPADLF
jgi:putative ABC transport system permease protein